MIDKGTQLSANFPRHVEPQTLVCSNSKYLDLKAPILSWAKRKPSKHKLEISINTPDRYPSKLGKPRAEYWKEVGSEV